MAEYQIVFQGVQNAKSPVAWCWLAATAVSVMVLLAILPHRIAHALPAPFTPIINVVPDVDTPNKARIIVITGQTLAGCPFAEPFIDGVASQLINGVVVRMDPVQTLAPCSVNNFANYRFELPYTPTAAGALRLVAASASGMIRSESRIRTVSSSDRTRAVGDITGIWHDTTTNGSGIQFTHNFAGSDFVFGTGYFYDLIGNARWLSLQNVVWQSGGTTLTADLLETRSATLLCTPITCPDKVTPRGQTSMAKLGTVRVSFVGLGPYSDTGLQGVVDAFDNNGNRLFSMTISRIAI
jgi:hypothetical protein